MRTLLRSYVCTPVGSSLRWDRAEDPRIADAVRRTGRELQPGTMLTWQGLCTASGIVVAVQPVDPVIHVDVMWSWSE